MKSRQNKVVVSMIAYVEKVCGKPFRLTERLLHTVLVPHSGASIEMTANIRLGTSGPCQEGFWSSLG